jgi:hypothetical protein
MEISNKKYYLTVNLNHLRIGLPEQAIVNFILL